jgi:hypothetical protein
MSDTGQHPAAVVPAQSIYPTLERIERKIDGLSDRHSNHDTRIALLEAALQQLVTLDARLRSVESLRSQAIGMGIAAGALVPILLKALHVL